MMNLPHFFRDWTILHCINQGSSSQSQDCSGKNCAYSRDSTHIMSGGGGWRLCSPTVPHYLFLVQLPLPLGNTHPWLFEGTWWSTYWLLRFYLDQLWTNTIKWTQTNIRIYLEATLCTEQISKYIWMQHIYQTNIRIYLYSGNSTNTNIILRSFYFNIQIFVIIND